MLHSVYLQRSAFKPEPHKEDTGDANYDTFLYYAGAIANNVGAAVDNDDSDGDGGKGVVITQGTSVARIAPSSSSGILLTSQWPFYKACRIDTDHDDDDICII